MKRIIYIFIVILITPFINGCTDLLDEENIRIPVADFYFTTEAGIEDATRAAYPFLRRYYGEEMGFTLTTFGTDIWLNGSDGGRKDFNNYGSGIQPGEWFVESVWNDHYLGIAACNAVIDRAPEAEMNDDLRQTRMGEAYFLRAVYYHILVMHFGDVPLELEETREVRTTATRAPESQVYEQIISDLEKAEDMLPGEQPDYGRATSWAAKAMLARIHLTVENYPQAYAYAKDVIDNGPFSLVPDYEELWSIDNIRNSETIWSIQYTADERLNGSGNRGHLYFLMEYDIMANMKRDVENGRPWKRFMPSRFFIDMLQSNRENDSRFEKSWKFAWMANNESTLMPGVNIGDTGVYVVPYSVPEDVHQSNNEKYVFFDIDDYFDPDSPNGEVPLGKRNRFPSLNKFIEPSRPTLQHVNGQRDWVVTRLAEMYLIGAEAAMFEEDPDEAANLINVVRRRAAWPGKEAEMEVSSGMVDLDFILDERARELCGEMFRWPDLKRTGKLIERVQLYNPDGRDNIKEYHLLRPIPTTMIDRVTNKEEFLQNPGY
ncbi:MAG: RagB/SusD family nutrient uptake outer membrane protein [Bacteroidales bacterium]